MTHPLIKTPQELSIIETAGRKLRRVMKTLLPSIQEGQTTQEIDNLADELIIKEGGEPGFKRVKGYKWATCLPINEQAVHTPPSKRKLKNGDILTVDIGLFYKGFHTDHAVSFVVGGAADKKIQQFLRVGEETLKKAINAARVGNYIGDISAVIEREVYGAGYFILKPLTGHGIGRTLHEDPLILGFVDKPRARTLKIQKGMALAIEVIYSMGTEEIVYEDASGWSIATRDGSLSACFEHTIAILDKNPVILT